MAVQVGNLLGAAANLTTALSKDKSLKSFLQNINKFGLQVSNNFEVNFSGLEGVTFFVESINFAGINLIQDTLYYNGRSIPVPIMYDYDHDGSMSVLNDGQGYIYAALTNFILGDTGLMASNNNVMTIKCLTGDPNYAGSLITLNSVVLSKVDGLQFGYSSNDISKFNVGFTYRDFTFTPGALATAAGVVGAIDNLVS